MIYKTPRRKLDIVQLGLHEKSAMNSCATIEEAVLVSIRIEKFYIVSSKWCFTYISPDSWHFILSL